MKLVVFCLFAVWCSSLASTSTHSRNTQERRKLKELLRQLKSVKDSLQNNEKMLSTPPHHVEDGCCLSTLQCYRDNLRDHFNITARKPLNKSLRSPLTVSGLCIPTNSGNVQATCQACDSHPKENAREFYNRLESLIEKGITRLSMN